MKTLLLLLLFCKLTYAQSPQQILEWINTAKSDNISFYYEIPFEYRNNEIVIQVEIGNKKYDYIFDTGGYNTINDAIQEINNFPVLTKQTVGSSNKLKTEINIVKTDTLKIGGLIFKDIAALQMDFRKSPTIQCTIDGGLIGAGIIKNYIWQIDYSNKKIIVTDQKDKLYGLADSVRIPVTFSNTLMPYIEMIVGGKTEKVMFDLGSSVLFSMTRKTAKRYHKTKDAITVKGGETEGGNGTVKEDVRIFRAPQISIGPLKFKNNPVYYADSDTENLLGNPIIKNYIITLNFKESEMFFTPITNSNPEEGWKSFGFTIGEKDGHIEVITLHKGLPADTAGLQLGDHITAIDGQPIECTNYCDCKKILSEKLNFAETISLTVLKNNTGSDITIKKKQVF